MTTTAQTENLESASFSTETIGLALVWLMFASSFVVTIEPAPCDFLALLSILFWVATGMKMQLGVVPLLAILLAYNMGGFFSFMQFGNEVKGATFVATSFYMAIMAVFFACFISENTERRMTWIMRGYIFGAVIAASMGAAGRLNIAGLASVFTYEERATGLFKDPNVFSTYLVFPSVMLMQGFMLGTIKYRLLSSISLLIIISALFLAFSRGAWINVTVSTILTIGFTFMLTPARAMRMRIVVFTIVVIGVAAILLALLLSVRELRELFFDRFTLLKNYDSGETGRFGNQLNAIPLLLQLPLGFGPGKFSTIFGIDPHNTFLNSFASYGWLGGISYFTLVITSFTVGWKAIMTRSPWQNYSILCYSCLIAVILQGVQIDMEHWRHFYWILGLTWGCFALSIRYRSPSISDMAA